MGFLSRMFVPRSVRRAVHPVRTVRRAVTPKPVRQLRRAMHPVDNAIYGVERALNTKPRRRSRAPVYPARGLPGPSPHARRRREVPESLSGQAVGEQRAQVPCVVCGELTPAQRTFTGDGQGGDVVSSWELEDCPSGDHQPLTSAQRAAMTLTIR